MTKKKVFLNKDGTFNQGAFEEWLDQNHDWLSNWLSNVIVIHPSIAQTLPYSWQLFRSTQLVSSAPDKMLDAAAGMKNELIKAAILGPGGGVMTPRGISITYLAGFVKRFNCLPTPNDYALFLATSWFELHIKGGSIITATGEPTRTEAVIQTYCTVDFVRT